MKGFLFAGISAGIKENNTKDLGLIYCETAASAAALFTKNKVVAAPVILGKSAIKSGRTQAILVNSGNANCFTGEKGIKDAETCAGMVSSALDIPVEMVLVASTGVIGQPLPMNKFEKGIPELAHALTNEGIDDFAAAILTTDLCPKVTGLEIRISNQTVTLLGIAKGSGMIRPDMATMLAFICTDAEIPPDLLKKLLAAANEKSFSRISVDGDTSTNDTLFAVANGAAGAALEQKHDIEKFQDALDQVCLDLAKMIVKDGEGAGKLVRIQVDGARTREDAFRACEAIAHSNLVKTAIYGEDPNWGRVTAAAGRSGADVDQDKMDLYFEQVPLVLKGRWQGQQAEKAAAQIMKQDEISIRLDLNLGVASDWFFFCDFSEDYVKINADYRS